MNSRLVNVPSIISFRAPINRPQAPDRFNTPAPTPTNGYHIGLADRGQTPYNLLGGTSFGAKNTAFGGGNIQQVGSVTNFEVLQRHNCATVTLLHRLDACTTRQHLQHHCSPTLTTSTVSDHHSVVTPSQSPAFPSLTLRPIYSQHSTKPPRHNCTSRALHRQCAQALAAIVHRLSSSRSVSFSLFYANELLSVAAVLLVLALLVGLLLLWRRGRRTRVYNKVCALAGGSSEDERTTSSGTIVGTSLWRRLSNTLVAVSCHVLSPLCACFSNDQRFVIDNGDTLKRVWNHTEQVGSSVLIKLFLRE